MDLTRVNRLKTNHLRDFNMKRDLYRHKYADIFNDFPDLSHYASPCDRTADYLTRFAAEFPAVIQDDELIAGIDWHWNGNHSVCNMGHFAADYTALLTNGTTAIINKTEGAFKKAMTAFSSYINTYAVKAGELGFTRIASDCSHIANLPPATFQQALQLVWFTHIFLHTEANSAAVSFGRFDQYLYPFLKSDMDAGRLTAEEARGQQREPAPRVGVFDHRQRHAGRRTGPRGHRSGGRQHRDGTAAHSLIDIGAAVGAAAGQRRKQETGLHLTGEEMADWLNSWGTADEGECPPCHV